MRSQLASTLTVGLAGLFLLQHGANAQEKTINPPDGFVALIKGDGLDGWHGMSTYDIRKLADMTEEKRAAQIAEWTADAKKHWSVKDGELVNDGHGAYLTTDKDYGDIELLVDYKTVPKADSGIYLRGTPQVQIWDYTPSGGNQRNGGDKGSGGLWNNSAGAPGKDPLVLADKPIGEWNSFRIIQLGARTTVYLNGKLVVDHATMENYFDRKSPLFAKGPIQLQTHGGEIRWKNVFLREIPADEATKMLEARNSEGFQTIFDGKSTEGWAGPIDNYEIVEGSLRCKTGKGGTIYYNKELGDFVARVEFRLPPGGNNGLAIRYPGKGDTAYAGMTELQVLDDTAPKYAKLDPRQAHGSAYGMVAAKRGYLRPVGEWNFEEVTVKGSKIKVELNGTVILDADLSTVQDFMANSPHPGKDRTSGFFGFAGHNDPVEFRNVAIKPIQ
jgi:3-keto-disaccharide hydrolase